MHSWRICQRGISKWPDYGRTRPGLQAAYRPKRSTPHSHPKTLCSRQLVQVTGVTISALRSRERRLESCHAPLYRSAPWWCPILGAKRERPAACMCGQMRSDAVSLTAHSALTSAYIRNQVRYLNVCSVRDEEAAGSNPATPTTKSQVTAHAVTSGPAQSARLYFQRLMNPTAAVLTSSGFPALKKCLPSWTTRSSASAELMNRLISSSALATEYTGSAVPCIHRTGHLTLSSRACRPSRSRRLTLLIRSRCRPASPV